MNTTGSPALIASIMELQEGKEDSLVRHNHLTHSEKSNPPSPNYNTEFSQRKFDNILNAIRDLKEILQQDEVFPDSKFQHTEFNLYWPNLSLDLSKLEAKLYRTFTFSSFMQTTSAAVCSSVHYGYFCILPEEVILHLFSYLDASDLCACASVCKEWKKFIDDGSLFKGLCERNGYAISKKPPTKSWLWFYRCHANIFTTPTKNGLGTYDLSEDRGRYIGEWKNNMRHGYGIQQWHDGSIYNGEWLEDKRDGTGTMTWADGQSYTGEWKNSRKEGKGVEVWADGRKYIGEYRNSNMHGHGTYTWPGGDMYVGAWVDDNMHGHGTYYWPNGSQYDGEWAADGHSGYGVYTCPGGEAYEGEWKGNFRHGFGVEKYKNHVYEGEWQSNRKYGKGVFRWPDSDYYIGEWKMGCKIGFGLLVSKGNVILQEWKEGEEGAGEEIEKAQSKGNVICTEQELLAFHSGKLTEFNIEKFLRRKRVRDDEVIEKKSKKKKKVPNHTNA